MEIPKQLIDCLDQNKVQYEILRHAEAVTAQDFVLHFVLI